MTTMPFINLKQLVYVLATHTRVGNELWTSRSLKTLDEIHKLRKKKIQKDGLDSVFSTFPLTSRPLDAKRPGLFFSEGRSGDVKWTQVITIVT